MLDHLSGYRIVLGSQSPRRQQLLKGLELDFDIVTADLDETFDPSLKKQEIPLFLSQEKANAIRQKLTGNYLLITCDTVVWIKDQVLNKPQSAEEATAMLEMLSGNSHEVFTGVTLGTAQHSVSFYDRTLVHFKPLNRAEIDHYVARYKPFDKAGSYGVQEWIGYVAITGIEGCFFNVMGLPLSKLYDELKRFAG
jgi:septum formation protein